RTGFAVDILYHHGIKRIGHTFSLKFSDHLK
ncbi:MAG: hypothetical protein RL336_1142, partial [Pseudomonadota bacterium]